LAIVIIVLLTIAISIVSFGFYSINKRLQELQELYRFGF
jgi:hypothetical protein